MNIQQAEMVMIPSTPTLVAEENLAPIEKLEIRDNRERRQVMGELVQNEQQAARVAKVSVREKKEELKHDKMPVAGDYFENDKGERFILKQKLGDGAMGHVFLSVYDKRTVAIKTEKFTTGMLPMEIKVLALARRERCKHFCTIFDYGSIRREYNYMVISLLGRDLYRLRNETHNRTFSLDTTTKIGLETIEAIEELHGIGYLSRDVKPSNFAPGLREFSEHKTIFMFDFGLAKKFLDRDNRKLKSRGEVGWRGTVRYGSLNAHKRLDLGRRDDLECWFYMLVEMYVGQLPWRFLTDRTAVGNAKQHVRNEGRTNFFHGSPKQFETIMNMIDEYQFETRPDYKTMKRLINDIRAEHNLSMKSKWDWQNDESIYSELTEPMSVFSDVGIMAEKGATNYTDRQGV